MTPNPRFLVKMGAAVCTIWLSSMLPVSALSMLVETQAVIRLAVNSSDVEIQRALDQLPSTGGEVVLVPGVYAIHHPLHLNRNNLALKGSGELTILRLADQADCPVVIMGSTLKDPEQVLHDLRLSNLVIDGNRSHQLVEQWEDPRNTSGIQNNGIIIQAVSNSIVEQVVAAHCRSGGLVTANGTRYLTVNDFAAFDNEFDGLACYRTENCVFTKLNLHDNLAAGISLDLDFNHNVISDSTLTGNDLGIFMRESNDNQFRNVSIGQSRHDGVFMAQWGRSAAAGWELIPQTECADNHFAGLKIHDCSGVAFRVNDAGCINNVIQDGIFSGNQNGGLVQAGANLVRIQDLMN